MQLPPLTHQITFLVTHDLDATHDFYAGALELPLVLDQGDCHIYRVLPGAYIGFCLRPDKPVETGSIILTLVTDDVDAYYTQLSAQGVPFEKTPAENPRYHIYQAFARDPNGYLIEIQRFLRPFDPPAA